MFPKHFSKEDIEFIEKSKVLPENPKEYYSKHGLWKGWKDFLGNQNVCDECGQENCNCEGEI